MEAIVVAVARSEGHTFSKPTQPCIRLVAGLGVEGDAHMGATIKHRSRLATGAELPNLRQVHLIHAELYDELSEKGFEVSPGELGENVTTRRIELLALPKGTLLHLGDSAVIEVTGLRNPCSQLDRFQQGLTAAVLDRDEQGNLVRKSGIMAVVVAGGEIKPGDSIRVVLPQEPHRTLECV